MQQKLNELAEVSRNILNNYTKVFDEFCTKHLPTGWKVLVYPNDVLKFGFVSGKYNDGADKYTCIEIYHGKNFDGNYEVTINPFTAGSFGLCDVDNYVHHYFEGVGIILNSEVSKELYDLCVKFDDEYLPIKDQINNLKNKIIEDEMKKSAEKAKQDQIEIENELKDKMTKLDDMYVVYMYANAGTYTFSYRRRNVMIFFVGTKSECQEYLNDNGRGISAYGMTRRIVNASKITFIR